MNPIWRFFLDAEQQWRWQQLSAARVLLAESPRGHKQYEQCVADAHRHGYVMLPSQTKLVK